MQTAITCSACTSEEMEEHVHFDCPNDGIINNDSVSFLCNTCPSHDVIQFKGMYLCPECLKQPDAFECRICCSREIKLLDQIEH